jgi:thioester reductase-like protein
VELLELLNDLASKGITLSLEGENLSCYAQKGTLTKELSERIALNKQNIINRLRGAGEVHSSPASEDAHKSPTRPGMNVQAQASHVPWTSPFVDLPAQAVLDPAIRPAAAANGGADFTVGKAIFLTGATGFVGAYLLHDLITVAGACVYCLVRGRSKSEGAKRIKDNLLKYKLWHDDLGPSIVAVPGDLAQPLLGVGEQMFDELCSTIDAVYHNGAVVNFVRPYSYLKAANVGGTEQVIRLACQTKTKPLHYVSTIGVYPPTTAHSTPILESDSPTNWQGLIEGYRQSKWVAEKMVTIAADRGLPVRIYRPGFVAGDSTAGIWNTDDFVPRLIKGCIQLGSVPENDATIEMAPVDYVSKAIVLLSRKRELPSSTFHVVSPNYVPTRDLEPIFAALGHRMKLLSYADWRTALLEDAKTSTKNALYPLLTMFTDTSPLEQVQAFDCRCTLEGLRGTGLVCPEFNTELMATYLTYFKNSGFLDS